MAVYGYVRVSTQSQIDDGLSFDAQQRQIEGYAMMHGMNLDHIFIERAVCLVLSHLNSVHKENYYQKY